MKEQETGSWLEKMRTVHISRRRFLRAAALGTGAALATSALAACGGGEATPAAETPTAAAETPTAAAETATEAAASGEFEVIYDGEVFDAGGASITLADWGGFWEEFQREGWLNQFEKDFNCQLIYDSSWPYYPKLVAGGVDNPPFDVVNQNLAEAFKSQEFYLPVAEVAANVPNSKNLWPFALQGTGLIGLVSKYGWAYRPDMVETAPKEFKDAWNDEFDGKRGTYITSNSLQHVLFMTASEAFGESDKDIEAGLQAMRDGAPWKVSDFTGNMQTLLERGEVVVGNQVDNEIFMMMDKGINIGWAPWEKKPVLCQNKSVTKGSKNKKLAYALINRWLEPEVQERYVTEQYATPTNKNTKISDKPAEKGIVNSQEALGDLWVPDWAWWNQNEEKIVEEMNRIFGTA